MSNDTKWRIAHTDNARFPWIVIPPKSLQEPLDSGACYHTTWEYARNCFAGRIQAGKMWRTQVTNA